MSNHATPKNAAAALSPKVKAAGWTAAGLLILQAVLGAVTPEMLDFAGEYSGLLFAAVTAAGAVVAAYLKGDGLRAAGADAVHAQNPPAEAERSSLEEPEDMPDPEQVPDGTGSRTANADALLTLVGKRQA